MTDQHDSDCAAHNMPAYPNGPCDCRLNKPVEWKDLLCAVARGWCHEDNSHKEMDSLLCLAIAREVQALYASKPAVPLTDAQIDELVGAAFDDHAWRGTTVMSRKLARSVEKAHNIGAKE